MKSYDIIIIGSGGGSKITRPAANLGKKVAIIEKGELGGTCLNHGCIPSKMLIHPADVLTAFRQATKYGIRTQGPITTDFESLVARVTQTVQKDSNSIKPMYDKHPNIDLYQGEAHFLSDKVIEVNGEQLRGDIFCIAAGIRAYIPPISGLRDTPFITYKEALRLTKQPKSMIIIGAGFIAVELGHFFGAMETKVDFLVRSQFLRPEDKDIVRVFNSQFAKQYPTHFNAHPESVSYADGQFTVTYRQDNELKTMQAEQLFVATGMTPNTDSLHVHKTSMKVDTNGYLEVDNTLQTSVPGNYAFGDIIGKHFFRHAANFEGEYVFKHIFSPENRQPIQYPPMPHAVFTMPQIGAVGATEDELIEKNIPYVVGLNTYKESAMGMALLSEEECVKLLFHRDTRVLLGAHIIGEEAATMVHMLIMAMAKKATLSDLLSIIYIHPALPETIRNACRKALRAFSELPK